MTDFQRLQGTWDVLALEQDGQPAPDAPLVKLVIIKDDQFVFRCVFPRSGEFSDEAIRFRIDTSRNPKAFDLSALEGGPANPGIYEFEGDTLRICWSRTTEVGSAPTEFATHRGSNRRLVVLKRSR
jgi:uncharacterized protein (TIGR03067 family)